AVPVPHHRHTVGVGRPHREERRVVEQVGSQLVVEAVVGALVPEIEVVVGEQRSDLARGGHSHRGYPWPGEARLVSSHRSATVKKGSLPASSSATMWPVSRTALSIISWLYPYRT